VAAGVEELHAVTHYRKALRCSGNNLRIKRQRRVPSPALGTKVRGIGVPKHSIPTVPVFKSIEV